MASGWTAAVQADPASGIALVGIRAAAEGTTPIHYPISDEMVRGGPVLLLDSRVFLVQLKPAGGNSFHALAVGGVRDQWRGKGLPVQYLMFSGNAWSGLIELGLADVGSFWGTVGQAISITNAGRGSALVVWPTAQGVVGRWIERIH